MNRTIKITSLQKKKPEILLFVLSRTDALKRSVSQRSAGGNVATLMLNSSSLKTPPAVETALSYGKNRC
jgi:hypothetical protein